MEKIMKKVTLKMEFDADIYIPIDEENDQYDIKKIDFNKIINSENISYIASIEDA